MMSAAGHAIRKDNFITSYTRARKAAFSSSNMVSSWRKTGIHPLNRDIIPKSAYAPAKNTTVQAAQPVAAALPAFAESIPCPQNAVVVVDGSAVEAVVDGGSVDELEYLSDKEVSEDEDQLALQSEWESLSVGMRSRATAALSSRAEACRLPAEDEECGGAGKGNAQRDSVGDSDEVEHDPTVGNMDEGGIASIRSPSTAAKESVAAFHGVLPLSTAEVATNDE